MAIKKYTNAALAVKNLPSCAVPKSRKKKRLGHDPEHVKHLHDFQAKLEDGLNELYRNFGPDHTAEANDYLKQAFGKVYRSIN